MLSICVSIWKIRKKKWLFLEARLGGDSQGSELEVVTQI
jgi:hypothetical protein